MGDDWQAHQCRLVDDEASRMPPAEQGESAADRTFNTVKEVADTPRIGRCSLERSCHRLRTRRCEARRQVPAQVKGGQQGGSAVTTLTL